MNIKLTLLLFVLIATIQLSCTSMAEKTTMEIFKDSISTYIHKNTDDPKSYEPIETVVWDTVTFLTNLEKRIKFYERAAKSFEEFGENGKDEQEQYLKDAAEFSALKDSLLSSPAPESPAAYIVAHKCRLKNKFGALILSVIVFEFRPDLTIYHVYEQGVGKSKGYPGGFPGDDR